MAASNLVLILNHVLLLAFGIGVVAGLRALTAPAVVAWAAHFGWLNLSGSRLAFMGSIVTAIIFSFLAIGELIGDKLPQTPKRTAILPLLARTVTGALCGACLFTAAGQSLGPGIVAGGIGGLIGAFVGYRIRTRLVSSLRVRDFIIAICEDVVAIALACFLVSH